jgi:hypothetical protein
MQNRSGVYRWGPAVAALGLAAVVGVWTYNIGLAQGLAAHLPPPDGPPYPWAYYRPWGVGPFFPLFVLLFWFFGLRFLIRGRGPGWWGGYHGDSSRGVPPMFEEWHRRSHERQAAPPPANG